MLLAIVLRCPRHLPSHLRPNRRKQKFIQYTGFSYLVFVCCCFSVASCAVSYPRCGWMRLDTHAHARIRMKHHAYIDYMLGIRVCPGPQYATTPPAFVYHLMRKRTRLVFPKIGWTCFFFPLLLNSVDATNRPGRQSAGSVCRISFRTHHSCFYSLPSFNVIIRNKRHKTQKLDHLFLGLHII